MSKSDAVEGAAERPNNRVNRWNESIEELLGKSGYGSAAKPVKNQPNAATATARPAVIGASYDQDYRRVCLWLSSGR
jgi:hypothetical protein